jgi:predicted transport protein
MALQPPAATAGAEPPAEQPTDRGYWDSKATKETLLATDELFKLVKEIQPKATLKYNKYYIGLEIDGSSKNFVTFVPQKAKVLMTIKIPQGKETDDQLAEAGIETLPYETTWKQYKVALGSAVNTKQRDVLLRLIRQAWEGYGKVIPKVT